MVRKLLSGFLVALVLTLGAPVINGVNEPEDPPVTATNNIVNVVQIG